jgi:hypothetical protein
MIEITNDKNYYTFQERIVVSVREHEQPQTGKTMKHVWEIFQQVSAKKPLQRRHYCDWSINILQQAT